MRINAKAKSFLVRNLQVVIIFVFLFILVIVSGRLNPDFFTWRNIRNLMVTAFPLLVVALGQTIVMLTGGIDLSLGAVVAISNVTCVKMMNVDSPAGFIQAVLIALLAGCTAGFLNGFIICKGKLAPIIVTLASTAIYDGLALFVMPKPGGKVHSAFGRFLTRGLGGVFPFILAGAIILIMYLAVSSTPFGKAVRAIGGNENAAYSTGVNVGRTKVCVFTIAGALSAVAGIFLSAQMNSGDATIGGSYSMNAITAAVVGGTAMSGAIGNPVGTVAGVFIIVVINNMLNLFAVKSFYQFILQGVILITALALGAIRRKR